MTPDRVVLVLNSGSSSLKYQLIEPDSGRSLADGTVEEIGEPSSPVADHDAALRLAFDQLSQDGIDLKAFGLAAVGHRVVHGGAIFYEPTVIDDAVIAELQQLSVLAPLHNPPAIQGIEGGPQDAAGCAAYRGVRHRFLSQSARGRGDLRHRP